MIARIWRARATVAGARDYDGYFTRVVEPELHAVRGFERAMVLHALDREIVEITVITWWASLDAIRGFAGDAIAAAVVHDEAARLLVDFDRVVTHHDVTVCVSPS
jgi:hypothetical protein